MGIRLGFSIKQKITAIIMMASCSGLALSCTSFMGNELITYRRAMVEDFTLLAEAFANNCAGALASMDSAAAQKNLAVLKAKPSIISAYIYMKDGSLFCKYARNGLNLCSNGDSAKNGEHPSCFDHVAIPPGAAADGYRFLDDHLELSKSIVLDGHAMGAFLLQSDLSRLHSRLMQQGIICLAVIAVTSLAAFLLSLLLQRVISKPILHMAQTIRAVSTEKDYSVRVEERSNDELAVLAEGFNEMLSQIRLREEQLKDCSDKLERMASELSAAREAAHAQRHAESRLPTGLSLEARASMDGLTSLTEPKLDTYPAWESKVFPVFQCSVLLAEDNDVNRQLAEAGLRKLGCRVTLAANGQEALEALSKASFELILMDCHMPEMDGYEATRIIRENEVRRQKSAERGRETARSEESPKRTPIIALTAQATQGERDKWLAAGMDDHLGKPFTLDQLCAILARWLPEAVQGTEEGTFQSEAFSRSAAIDQGALQNIRALQEEGEPDILTRVVNNYLKNAPELLKKLHKALSGQDASALRLAAHSLKSSSANLGAHVLADLCKKIEILGQTDRLEHADEILQEVEAEYSRTERALRLEIEQCRIK